MFIVMCYVFVSCGESIAKSSPTSTPAPEPVVESVWKDVKIIDEFGDVVPGKTGRCLLIMDGKFSNSATTNSPLGVRISEQISNKTAYISIDLYEYLSTTPTRLSYEDTFGSFSCKLPNGTIKRIKCFVPKSGGLFFSEKDYTVFKKLLVENKEFKCSITPSDFSNNGSSYNFSIVQ